MMKEFTVSMNETTKTNRSRFGLDEEAEDDQQVTAPTARALRKELFSDELIDHLLARVGEDGLALTGRGGLLPEMLKAVLERGMGAEQGQLRRLRLIPRGLPPLEVTPVRALPRLDVPRRRDLLLRRDERRGHPHLRRQSNTEMKRI